MTPQDKPRPAGASRKDPPSDIQPELLESDFLVMLEGLSSQGLELDPETRDRLRAYGRTVIFRAGMLNLISPADRGRFHTRHLAECLAPALVERASQVDTLVDIGTGAGLPGIPLAIVCPKLEVLLVEPRLRKSQFLESAVAALGLSDRVGVFQGTVESLARDGGMAFDLATARAVGRIPAIWGPTVQILRPGGWLVTFKGPGEVEEEVSAIRGPTPRVETRPLEGRPRSLVFLQAPA